MGGLPPDERDSGDEPKPSSSPGATKTNVDTSSIAGITKASGGSSPAKPQGYDPKGPNYDPQAKGVKPVLLDLDGDGVEITSLDKSTQHIIGDDGLRHRTAWAGAGDGVLFVDVDGDDSISTLAEYVFTEWDRTASDDMEALARVFDTSGDGKLSAADAQWDKFHVMVTNADGTTEVLTLTDLGITEINLRPDTTRITLPDGSQITGQTTFTMNGVGHIAANTTLVTEEQGYRVVPSAPVIGADGKTTTTQTAYDAAGAVAYIIAREVSGGGSSTVTKFDTNGDGVVDQFQTMSVTTNSSGAQVELVANYRGADASGELLNRTHTVRHRYACLYSWYLSQLAVSSKLPFRVIKGLQIL